MTTQGPAKTVLIVDDNEEILATTSLLAATGEAGLKLARVENPDIVLLDLMLPDMAGAGVLKSLRGDPLTQGILIIVVTAKADEVDRIVGFEVGADDYVVKPYSVRELLLRVEAVLRRNLVQARTKLLGDVWGLQGELTTRTVDTHVKRLRDKLGKAGRFIKTVRGVGYRFTEFGVSKRK